MTPSFEIVVWVVMMLSLAYLVIIAVFTYGWFSLEPGLTPKAAPSTNLSVVVAVRNESKNIERLLESLLAQEYPKELMEVIIVDDHSEDDTVAMVNRFYEYHQELFLKVLASPGTGKKEAIAFGIKNAQSGFILTTDGDCIADRRWVREMSACYEVHHSKIILGPVVYANEKTLLQKS